MSILPDVSEFNSPFHDQQCLIPAAALLRKMAEKIFNKAHACYEKDYGKHVWFKSRFAVCDYVFFELPRLIASAADRKACKAYLKLLPRRTGTYRAISIKQEYVNIDHDGTQNTLSMKQQNRMIKEE